MILNPFKTKITLYENCESMPLWNFQKYLETHDLKYFSKEHKNHRELESCMMRFYDDYLKRSKSASYIISRFGTIHKILRLTQKYNTVTLLLQAAYNYPVNGKIERLKEITEQLEKWNYKIDKEKDLFKQLEAINNRIQGIKTQIALLEDELKKEDIGEATTIENQLISVSRILELGYKLNVKKITVLEWIAYQDQAEKEVINRQKQRK